MSKRILSFVAWGAPGALVMALLAGACSSEVDDPGSTGSALVLCDINECPGTPADADRVCADGSIAAATGRCVLPESGVCEWETASCEGDGEGEVAEGPRDGEGGAAEGPRDGDGEAAEGPRDGEGEAAEGPRDGDGEAAEGPRDGDGEAAEGPRDGEGEGGAENGDGAGGE